MRCRFTWCHVALLCCLSAGCGDEPAAPTAAAKPAAATTAAAPPLSSPPPAASSPTGPMPPGAVRSVVELPAGNPAAAKAASPASAAKAGITQAARAPNATAKSHAGSDRSGALSAASSAAADALKTMNPFKPPKLDVLQAKPEEISEESKSVRLIGFIDTGEMKALLTFDGKLQSLSTGDVYNNVSIVEITPPHVTLKHGQKQWQATLFKQPIINTTSGQATTSSATPQVTIGDTSTPVRKPASFERLFPTGSSRGNPFPNSDIATPPLPERSSVPAGPPSRGIPGAPVRPSAGNLTPPPIAPPPLPAVPTIPAIKPATP